MSHDYTDQIYEKVQSTKPMNIEEFRNCQLNFEMMHIHASGSFKNVSSICVESFATYTSSIKSSVNSIMVRVFLLKCIPNSIIDPPSLTTKAEDHVVLEGGPPIQLNCVADGEPKPNITWTEINSGSDSDILFVGENFVVPNNRSNAGTYRCEASNGIGNDVNHTATVVVNCEYQFISVSSN